MDVGSEINNYHSDITRTVPIVGMFSKRQKEVYEAKERTRELEKRLEEAEAENRSVPIADTAIAVVVKDENGDNVVAQPITLDEGKDSS